MKKAIIIAIITFVIFYILKEKTYRPYLWKRALNTQEHQLKEGSFIFSKQRGSNGSQSLENKYFVFKVTEITGDYVRLSVIRRLSKKDARVASDFSITSEQYQSLKENVQDLLITPILVEDLYKGDGPTFTLNGYLLEKYPALKTSPYYYEVVPYKLQNTIDNENLKNSDSYLDLVYSKKEILERAKLTPYRIKYNGKNNVPAAIRAYSESISLIKNKI